MAAPYSAAPRLPGPQPTAPSFVVAKTMLTATLMRPDPTPLSKDEIMHFHALLDAAILQCSPSNLQRCKEWLLRNTVPSPKRADALGKYLARLSQTFAEADDGVCQKRSKHDGPSKRRKALHVLCILNDLLQHTRTHHGHLQAHVSLTKTLEPHLETLITTALSLQIPNKPKLRQRIAKLVELYEPGAYYSEDYRERVRKALENANVLAATQGSAQAQVQRTSTSKDAPYVLPSFHGELNDPWYDLPAGALMPHIRPNDPRPIDTRDIKAVELGSRTVGSGLINAVKDLISYSASLYDEDEGIVADMDMMGQPLVRDEITGELGVAEGYYGWSVEFCERMKKRRREGSPRNGEKRFSRNRSISSSRSRSYSRGRDRSTSRDRKRRYSSSVSRSRSRNRSEKRRRDDSRSFSRPGAGLGGGRDGGRGSPSRSPYRSRSRSTDRPRGFRRSSPLVNREGYNPSPQFSQPPPPNPYSAPNQAFPPPPPQQYYAGFQGGAPPLPPPPFPHYNGPWPPPPPPMQPNGGFHQQAPLYQQYPGFPPQMPQPNMPMGYGMPGAPPPPPPNYPPNQPWQQQQQPYGGYNAAPPPNAGPQQWQYDRSRGRRY